MCELRFDGLTLQGRAFQALFYLNILGLLTL